MSNDEQNGWAEYKQRVFFQLDQLTTEVKEINAKLDRHREDIIVLKVKAWAFGVMGGLIVTIIFETAIKILGKQP